MIYFLVLPFWALAILLGIVLLFFPKLRFLSLPILFGSTLAITLSAVGLFLSAVVLAGLSNEIGEWKSWQRFGDIGSYVGGGIGLLAILGGFAVGTVVGGLIGLVLAWWANRKLGWSYRPLLECCSERLDRASARLANR